MASDGLNGTLGRSNVESYLCRVNFKSKVNIFCFEGVEDRSKAVSEVFKALIPVVLVGRWECVDRVPDARTSKAIDSNWKIVRPIRFGIEKLPCSLGRVYHALSRTLADAFGITITPDFWRENCLVALVYEVTNRLAH